MTLILRPDEKKAGLYHVIGCTERTSVGFFDRDKKDPTDGFSQKDLCFAARPGFVREEFVNEEEVFKYLGTSSVVESGSNLLVAWSGAIEGRINTGIWMSQLTNDKWGQPTKIAEAGPRDDEDRLCRHPALVQPAKGPLMLFYDWHPSKWLILAKKYDDSEKKWTDEAKIGHWEGNIKGRPIQLGDGALLVPTHTAGGKLRFERTSDGGKTWADQVLAGDAKTIAAIQPCVFRTGKDKLQALAQTKQDRICQTFSEDDGKTWSKLSYTTLPSPNTGIDAIALADGRFLVVYNHASSGTSPLNVAVSSDGKDWKAALVLEQGAGEFVEPSVIQTSDGLVHVTYTWNQKKVKHVVLDPKKLELHEMKEGKWPE